MHNTILKLFALKLSKKTLFRMEIATGAAQPIVGRDRESVVIYQVSCSLLVVVAALVAFVCLL